MHVYICIPPLHPWLRLETLAINSPPTVLPTCQNSSAIRRALLSTFQITKLTAARPTFLSHFSLLGFCSIAPIMAYKTRSSVPTLISISVILLALVGGAVSGRNVRTTSNKDDKKQPQWFHDHDRSFVIPGIGRVMLPPLYNVSPYAPPPITGSTGGSGGSPSSDDYVPGGDDTYAPTPGNGGGSPTGAPTP